MTNSERWTDATSALPEENTAPTADLKFGLSILKKHLEIIPETTPEIPTLEVRMIPFELTEIEFLEKQLTSFKRGKKIATAEWYSFIHNKQYSRWADVYGSGDDDYYQWDVWLMKPSFPNESLKLICIQTQRFGEIEFNMGLVTPEELKELINSLAS